MSDEKSQWRGRSMPAKKGVSATVMPPYSQPQPTLTDAERAALEYGIRQADEYDRLGLEDAKRAAIVFRGLLERLK